MNNSFSWNLKKMLIRYLQGHLLLVIDQNGGLDFYDLWADWLIIIYSNSLFGYELKAKDCCYVDIFHFLNVTETNWLDYFDLNRSNHIFGRNSVCFASRFDRGCSLIVCSLAIRWSQGKIFEWRIRRSVRPGGRSTGILGLDFAYFT